MPAEALAAIAPETPDVERKPANSLAQLARHFLKLVTIGFGGPVPLIEYTRRDLVEERGWIPGAQYRDGLAHSREAHAAEHARAGINADSHDHAPTQDGGPTLSHPDGPDHPHPRIAVAPATRVDALVGVAALVLVFTWREPGVSPAPPIPALDRLPSSRPPGSPPPSLRASPLA